MIALSMGCMVLGAGCSSLQGAPDPVQGQGQDLKSIDALYDEYVKDFFKATDPVQQVAIRNAYITIRLAQIDRAYSRYREDLFTQRAGTSVGFDAATLGLAGIGAATSSVAAKTNTSALSAALIGTKASIDKNVYIDRTLPALISEMEGQRAEIRALIEAGMLLPPDRYHLANADGHLSSYFDAGSLIGAMKSLTNRASVAEAKANETLRARLPSEADLSAKLKGLGFATEKAASTPAALSLQKCVLADGSWLVGTKEPIEAWFKVEQPKWLKTLAPDALPPKSVTPLSDFIAHPAYEPLRAQAVKDPSLKPVLEKCAQAK